MLQVAPDRKLSTHETTTAVRGTIAEILASVFISTTIECFLAGTDDMLLHNAGLDIFILVLKSGRSGSANGTLFKSRNITCMYTRLTVWTCCGYCI